MVHPTLTSETNGTRYLRGEVEESAECESVVEEESDSLEWKEAEVDRLHQWPYLPVGEQSWPVELKRERREYLPPCLAQHTCTTHLCVLVLHALYVATFGEAHEANEQRQSYRCTVERRAAFVSSVAVTTSDSAALAKSAQLPLKPAPLLTRWSDQRRLSWPARAS